MVGTGALDATSGPPDYRAAKEGLAHRVRKTAVLDVEGPDGIAFLQGQLTQEVRSLAPGEVRPSAALTPKGKLLFLARLVGLPQGRRLVLPRSEREPALAHLKKFVIFQKVEITDRSDEFVRFCLYGPRADDVAGDADAIRLPPEGELAAEILVAVEKVPDFERVLERAGSVPLTEESFEILRVEAGRPRFGQDVDASNLADEAGLDAAISTTKGCYVGQEIVARMRTYGRVNRRLVGFRFPEGAIAPGTVLRRPEEPEAGKVEQGRVTSSILSPHFGPIGLGFAFRDVAIGARLVSAAGPALTAVVAPLPFVP